MSKKILITSTDLMMIQFLVPHAKYLSEHGYEVEIACSEVGGRMEEVRKALEKVVNVIHVVRLVRSPVSFKNILGYQDMRSVFSKKRYDIVWTNEPVMGVVTRLAAKQAREQGTKVIYMTHGFHFYDGAPKLNWMVYYPVERYMSRWTDMIITINREDFERAKTMRAKEVKYVHGIGVNTDRLQKSIHGNNIREELHIAKSDFIVISAGELNENKNHRAVINALGLARDRAIHYLICGKGKMLKQLQALADDKGLGDNVHFLGYRKDVIDLYKQADIFVFPSHREGLGLAPLEAMYCGLPLITSDIRGPKDFMENGKTGYLCPPDDAKAFMRGIQELKQDVSLRGQCGKYNQEVVKPYLLENVRKELFDIFCTI